MKKSGYEPKFSLKTFSFLSSAANSSVEFAAFDSGSYAKHSRASAVCFFFLSTTMVFATVQTHFLEVHITWIQAFGRSPEIKHSTASAFRLFSVHNNGFCGGPNTFSREKHPFFVDQVVIFLTFNWKNINIKINRGSEEVQSLVKTNKKVDFYRNNKVTIRNNLHPLK